MRMRAVPEKINTWIDRAEFPRFAAENRKNGNGLAVNFKENPD